MAVEPPKPPQPPRPGGAANPHPTRGVAHPADPDTPNKTVRKLLRIGTSDAVTIPIKWTTRWVNPAYRLVTTTDNDDGTITVAPLHLRPANPPIVRESVE